MKRNLRLDTTYTTYYVPPSKRGWSRGVQRLHLGAHDSTGWLSCAHPEGEKMARIKMSQEAKAHAVTERLLDWREEAQRAGRTGCEEVLLLLAWRAYDRLPSRAKKAD